MYYDLREKSRVTLRTSLYRPDRIRCKSIGERRGKTGIGALVGIAAYSPVYYVE